METRKTLKREANTILISARAYFDILNWNRKVAEDIEKVVNKAICYGYHLGLRDAAEIIEKRKEQAQ